MYSDGLLANVARSVGVPEMWVDDCIQELRIAEWQQRRLRSAAIDFVRIVGPHTRHGTSRAYTYLDGHDRCSADWTDVSDKLLDLEVSFSRLKDEQKTALLRAYLGFAPGEKDWILRYWGRQELRKVCPTEL